MVIAGNKNSPIRTLHWFNNPSGSERDDLNPLMLRGQPRRLLSTGLNGVVIEWDLLQRSVKHIHTVHAPVWCSALVGKLLYLACEDGSIKILKVKKEKIELARTLTKAESRCLCLEVTPDGKHVYAGYADSSVRRWGVESGNCTLHLVKATKAV